MNFITILGLVAALTTTAAFVPQAYKTIKSRSADDLSLPTFSMLFIGTLLWFSYGYLIGDLPIQLANGITAFLAGIILYIKIFSSKNQS